MGDETNDIHRREGRQDAPVRSRRVHVELDALPEGQRGATALRPRRSPRSNTRSVQSREFDFANARDQASCVPRQHRARSLSWTMSAAGRDLGRDAG